MNPQALYNITYGLYLLSVRSYAQDNACIINTVMQVAENPVRLAISVNKRHETHDMIMESGRFNVSALTTDTPFELFQRFGMQSGRDVNKFIGFDAVKRADNGIYVLTQFANAFFSCKLVRAADLGTHTLFIAEAEDAQVLSDKPACTYGYYQSDIKPKPQAAKKTGWVCTVCGHVHEGETLAEDYVCPLCGHGRDDFRKLN